jgi:hypothetical protein
MPPGLIRQEQRMGSWSDHLCDFREMQVHYSVLQVGKIRAAPFLGKRHRRVEAVR